MEEFNKNFKDNQGLILNKYKRSNFCITNDSNIIANSQISFENLHSKYYFNFNKGLDIFANDINDDSNYINFKNEIKYLKNDEKYLTKLQLNNNNNHCINNFQKVFSFILELKKISDNTYIKFDLSTRDKVYLVFFYDIISSEAINKIKDIYYNYLSLKKSNNIVFLPVINSIISEEENLEQYNNFLKISQLDTIDNYILTKQKNLNLIRVFGLDSLIEAKLFLINTNGEFSLIWNENLKFFNINYLKFYLEINNYSEYCCFSKDIPKKFNDYLNIEKSQEIIDKIEKIKERFNLDIIYEHIKLDIKKNKTNNLIIYLPIMINIDYSEKDNF